jgi:hypothetical protein
MNAFGQWLDLFAKTVIKCQIALELLVVADWKIDLLESLHPFDPEKISDCNRNVVFHQQHVDTALHASGIPNQPLSMPEQLFEFSSF